MARLQKTIMNTTDTIASLFKQGCKTVTFMQSPKGACVIQAEQIVATGQEASFARVMHQEEAGDFADCLNQLKGNVEYIAGVKPMIVVPIKRN